MTRRRKVVASCAAAAVVVMGGVKHATGTPITSISLTVRVNLSGQPESPMMIALL